MGERFAPAVTIRANVWTDKRKHLRVLMLSFSFMQPHCRSSALRCSLAVTVVVAVSVIGVIVPGSLAVQADESQTPVETDEETQETLEECVVERQRRVRLVRHLAVGPADREGRRRSCRVAQSQPHAAPPGHRLPNGLLAPLTI